MFPIPLGAMLAFQLLFFLNVYLCILCDMVEWDAIQKIIFESCSQFLLCRAWAQPQPCSFPTEPTHFHCYYKLDLFCS